MGAKSPLLWDEGQVETLLAGSPVVDMVKKRLQVGLHSCCHTCMFQGLTLASHHCTLKMVGTGGREGVGGGGAGVAGGGWQSMALLQQGGYQNSHESYHGLQTHTAITFSTAAFTVGFYQFELDLG